MMLLAARRDLTKRNAREGGVVDWDAADTGSDQWQPGRAGRASHGAVESLQVEEYTTTDELVWFAVETAMCHGCISHGDIVLVVAGAADRPKGAAPDVLRIVQVT
jgi:hypothetical protein